MPRQKAEWFPRKRNSLVAGNAEINLVSLPETSFLSRLPASFWRIFLCLSHIIPNLLCVPSRTVQLLSEERWINTPRLRRRSLTHCSSRTFSRSHLEPGAANLQPGQSQPGFTRLMPSLLFPLCLPGDGGVRSQAAGLLRPRPVFRGHEAAGGRPVRSAHPPGERQRQWVVCRGVSAGVGGIKRLW